MGRSDEFHAEKDRVPAQQWDEGDRTFVYTPPDHPMNWHGKHVLSVHSGDQSLGNMSWDESGRVDWVGIDPREQRRGHGSALWQAGQSLADRHSTVPRPVHSETQTDAGKQWSDKVGGDQVADKPAPRKWTITVED